MHECDVAGSFAGELWPSPPSHVALFVVGANAVPRLFAARADTRVVGFAGSSSGELSTTN